MATSSTKTDRIIFRATPADRRRFGRAAKREGQDLSGWLTGLATRASARSERKARATRG